MTGAPEPSSSDVRTRWARRLADRPPALELPTYRARAADHQARLEHVPLELPGELAASLSALAGGGVAERAEGLLAAFALLLYRTTRQVDLVLGAGVADTVLPLRLDLADRPGFRGLLARVRAGLAERGADPATLDEVLTATGAARASELFQAAFVADDEAPEDMELVLLARPDGIELAYDAELLAEDDARGLAERFEVLLAAALAEPDRSIGTLPFLTPEERERILVQWNDKRVEFPTEVCLHELFETKVDETPEAVAAVFGERKLTYRELDERANQVAHHLRSLGVGRESLVGISVERSFEMVIGLQAIAKAGGAYVPMDPTYPKERLAFLLEDSAVEVLLTQRHLADALPSSQAKPVFLDADAALFDRQPTTRPETGVTAENLAYVIYTSGSTGAPKGVELDHRGRVNNFLDFNRRFSVGHGDALIALASLSFDMCAYDVFGSLAAGATIVLPAPGEMQDPAAWARIMGANGVTIWHTAPAMLGMLVEHLESLPDQTPQSLRLVLLGGDWIPVTLPDRVRALKGDVTVVSMGGATECSMDSTIFVVEEVDPAWNSIPYGEPMWNQLAYVLDDDLQPLPVGVPGELYLGGVGVGRGYHQRPELTAERFLPNPFVDEDGTRMYRTGDLARWMPDGNLELLGRMDNQIKIRGYRIELGEIEARMRQHDAVKEGVVVARGDRTGERRLIAYVVQDSEWKGPEDGAEDLGSEQVEQWQAVYDHAYSANVDEERDPTFNIVSWDSSYTNEALPADQMRLWVDQTIDRIARHRPQRALEIGCGMGLLLFRLAPNCTRYVGSDFSKVALDYVHRHADRLGLSQVELESRWADDFTGIEDGSLDSIVLNSIVLDFPSMDYLMEVLRGSARAVRSGGTIFVGDVRSLPLLESYQSSVQLFQADDDLGAPQLRAKVQRLIRQEEELVIDPRFFQWAAAAIPELAGVQVQLKRGDFVNELNAFRYDVTLYVGEAPTAPTAEPQRLDWSAAGLDLERLRVVLTEDRPESLVVTEVPNRRVQRDVRTVALLADDACSATAGELRARLDELDAEGGAGVNPEHVWALAEELGYAADVRWSASAAEGRFDAAFVLRNGKEIPTVLFGAGHAVAEGLRAADFANNPMMGKLSRQLGPELRRHLATQLPDYMVPAVYVPLDAMPLSPNGKVDRKRLPEPDTSRPDIGSAFQPPKDPVEEIVAGVWTDVLGLDRVGVEDAFLDLGGHSILAVQVQSRLNEFLPFEITLPDIFRCETVARLAEHLRAVGLERGLDVEEVCRTLMMIEDLSDEEVEQMASEPT